MKNNWSNLEAKKYIKKYTKLGHSKDMALRVYTTRLLGRNSELVLHGGGNTSVKTSIKDIDGKNYEVLCVKGSGWDMAEIEPAGLPAVKLNPLLALKNKKYLSDEDMVAYQKRNLIDIKSPNPSVETFLHAFLPFKFVDHTHSDAIMDVTNRQNGKDLCKKIFGAKVSIVPYVMPGFGLAQKINEVYNKNPNINCLILLNHGIFTFDNDAKKSYDLMIKYVSIAEKTIRKLKRKKIKQIKKYNTKFKPHEIAPILRGLLTEKKDQKFILNYRTNKNLNYFINGKDVKRYSGIGTATPDHVIRVKPFPLVISPKENSSIEDFKKLAEKSFNDYRKKYVRYFNTNKKKVKGKKTMLDTSPRVILVQNVGLFSVGDSLKASKIAGDLTETNARVISSVEETTKYKFIPEKDLFDVEYWSLEQAKIKKAKKILQGNIVVITGGFGAIGTATYKLFKTYGAEIVLLDYDEKKVKEMQSKITDLCLHCDVRNKNSVKDAFKKINEIYGGVDILISNAGTAIGGSIAEVDDKILRKSFEDNFFSHQNCASETIKIMKKQNIQGCLLFNISKQSVNPGKNFGPYGLPKTALLSLCKQYAVDYGSLGIRSNGVNADRIRSGLLNDGMIKSRAKAREVSTDEYMRGNLLLNEVKAEDVAKAFFHLAVSKKTTGAVLTVDGGNIAASLR
ncbi:bifunctional aldolase/short-chain dehydrogenase [Candidatus Pelagibacter sp.]|uniref:bifunctional aldolase/short-chain dehydrogenase n=1 Tax=Candidatus Pelagibacter sp. TaxID=2024849 RepID=UPI003F8279FA